MRSKTRIVIIARDKKDLERFLGNRRLLSYYDLNAIPTESTQIPVWENPMVSRELYDFFLIKKQTPNAQIILLEGLYYDGIYNTLLETTACISADFSFFYPQ